MHIKTSPNSMNAGWYTRSDGAKKAFLFNCSQDDDLSESSLDSIRQGTLVLGGKGWVAAERHVFAMKARTTGQFLPTRKAKWQDFEIAIMVHPDLPAGKIPKSALRPYNHAVGELTTEEQCRIAESLKLPLLKQSDGRQFINVELASFGNQGAGSPRRATLI